jgi:RimJ/RimL family protein N-acetyltransferase
MTPRPLEGKLVRLRALEALDEPLVYRWINDPEVAQWLMARLPFSHQQIHDYIAQSSPSYEEARFGIESRSDGSLIGVCYLALTALPDRRARLGIEVGDRARWGRGYGTDAMVTLCRYGFAMMNLHRIELEVFRENERAIRVYERTGFRVEGTRREAAWKFGRYHDLVLMGLLEGELVDADGT